jgi:hypothetical protein
MNDYLLITLATIAAATFVVLAWMDGYANGKRDERRRADERIAGILDREHARRMRGGRK